MFEDPPSSSGHNTPAASSLGLLVNSDWGLEADVCVKLQILVYSRGSVYSVGFVLEMQGGADMYVWDV